MDCSKHQVASFGRVNRCHERFFISKLTHKNDVGVLPESVLHAALEGLAVEANLTLFDDRLAILVAKFDGILERDDVLAKILVDVLDHGGERRRFAAAALLIADDDDAELHCEVYMKTSIDRQSSFSL